MKDHDRVRADSPNLDAIRSLAVLLVVVSHLPALQSLFGTVDPAALVRWYDVRVLGRIGVMIFFVHTCFVLLLSLERYADKHGTRFQAAHFFTRRAFRIYPLSIVAVATMATVGRSVADTVVTIPTFLSNVLLVQNLTGHGCLFSPLWSLPYEVQMYLALPALFLLVRWAGSRAPGVVAALWFGSVALTVGFNRLGLPYLYYLVLYVPCFMGGVLAYALSRRAPRRLSPLLLLVPLGLLIVAVPAWVARGGFERNAQWAGCLLLGATIPWCRDTRSEWLARVAKTIARYSYGIYLVHYPVVKVCFGLLGQYPGWVQWGIFLAAVPLLSFAGYHAVEKPGIAIGMRAADRLTDLLHRRFGNPVPWKAHPPASRGERPRGAGRASRPPLEFRAVRRSGWRSPPRR